MGEALDRIYREVSTGSIAAVLPDETRDLMAGFSAEDVRESCRHVLVRPHPLEVPLVGRELLNAALAGSWLLLFEALGVPRNLVVYEPCAGSSEPIILAAQAHSGGAARYVTCNLNRRLAAELRGKLGHITMDVTILDDYAQAATAHLEAGGFDVACFHHAVNDILQTAVSEPRGMVTREVEWWSNERQMIEWLAEDHAAGRLDERARPALLAAVREAVSLVKPGGWLLFDHWTWEKYRHVDWFPWRLFSDLIPMARAWIAAEGLPLREVAVAGREPQWWMCLRRDQ
jgi:hypothetical protein